MKKNVLAASVALALAGFAGTTFAQTAPVPFLSNAGATNAATNFAVNGGGIGHILLTPYYTVQGDRNTLLNITNTDTVNGKAVKVRFRGARNSDDVFDFYVFLSPGDNWRARVHPDGELVRVDVSADTSCTLPNRNQFPGASFSTGRVFEHRPGEVREGYVEMLTAADIPPTLVGGGANPFYNAIKHNANGEVSCAPAAIQAGMIALTTPDAASAAGLAFPTTGLIGQWAITQVATNSTVSGNMTAVEARTEAGLPGAGNIVVSPQNGLVAPAAWTATAAGVGTADPLFLSTTEAASRLTAQNFDFPDLSTPYLGSNTAADQINQLSAGMAVNAVMNEFTTGVANFRTDWVLTMPTRRYGVAIDYASNSLAFNPSNNYFSAGNTTLVQQNGVPTAQVQLLTQFWDMDERGGEAAAFSPGNIEGINGEVSVMSFNRGDTESVLGAQLTTFNATPTQNHEVINAGWGQINAQAAGAGTATNGLPLIGYAAVTAGGQNLGFTWPHRYRSAVAAPATSGGDTGGGDTGGGDTGGGGAA